MKTTRLYFKSYCETYFDTTEEIDLMLGIIILPIFIIGIPLVIIKDGFNILFKWS